MLKRASTECWNFLSAGIFLRHCENPYLGKQNKQKSQISSKVNVNRSQLKKIKW